MKYNKEILKIYVARHGQNQDNVEGILNGRRDHPLTELGIVQAQNLADHIKLGSFNFDAVYSSPLCRAFDTAEVITKTLGMPNPIKLELLIERDFGSMTGKLAKDVERLCAPDVVTTDTITYFLNPEGAETFPELIERGKKVISYLGEVHPEGGSVLLVCHGDIGKMIYAAFYSLEWKEVLTDFHFGNSEMLLLSRETSPNMAHVFKQDQFSH